MVWDGAVVDRVTGMTGVVGRWRAADLGTDGGGPLANNAAVTSWTARVGNNATGSGTYIAASGINSRPAVRLNGTSNTFTATTSSRAQPVTLAVVFRTTATNEQQLYLTGTAQAFTNGSVWAVDLGSSTLAGGSRNSSPHVLTVTQSGAATTGRMDGATILGPGSAGAAGLGSSLVWGSFFGGRWFTGDIAEVVVWNHALTTAELADWHSYVQDAYGVTVADYQPPPVTSVAITVHGARSQTSATTVLLGQRTGLTIDGARSGSRTGPVLLAQSSPLTVAGARSGSRAAAVLLDQAQTLTVAGARAASRAGTVLLSQASPLTVPGVRSDSRAGSPLLAQATSLTVPGARSETTAGSPLLEQSSPLTVGGARSATRTDAVLLAVPGALLIDRARSSTRATTVLLAQRTTLTVQPARAQTRTMPVLLAGPLALTVAPVRAETRAGVPALAQRTLLTVAAARAPTRAAVVPIGVARPATPTERTLTVPAENRSYPVPADNRLLTVAAESRTLTA